MLRRYFPLMISLLLLAGCVRHPHQTPLSSPLTAVKSKVETRAMSTFNRVDVQGAINVNLRSGYKRPAVILRGDPRDLMEIITEIKNDTLLITVKKGAPKFGSIAAEIHSPYLNSLAYKGMGTVVGNNLHSSLLDLNIDNAGQTTLGGSIVVRKLDARGGGSIIIKGASSRHLQLEISDNTKVLMAGVMNVNKLKLKGDGWLTMYWVKSPMLTICAKGVSTIQLAGVVNKLELELRGSARFKGRYLRVKNAFVKTHDKAIAEISALKHQHALATDASDIYFYTIPQTKTDFMAYQGSILDMRDLSLPDLQNYDRYNKDMP